MGSRKPRGERVEVEELSGREWGRPIQPGGEWGRPMDSAGGWEQPPDDGPGPTERLIAWVSAHRRPVTIGTAALAVVAVLAVVVSSPGPSAPVAAPPTTVAPSTTTPRPVSTRPPATTAPPAAEPAGREAAAGDGRMALTEIPAGYLVSNVETLDGEAGVDEPHQLFVGPDARWSTGPWMMVDVADEETEIQRSRAFTRPPTTLTVGGAPAAAGVGAGGIEQLVFRSGDQIVVISGRGLPPGAALAVAEAGSFGDDVVGVPASALPASFAVRQIDDPAWWSRGWSMRPPLTTLSLHAADRNGSITVGNRPYDPDTWSLDDAGFFLDDLRYLTIGGNAAVAGTIPLYDGSYHIVMWRAGDRELFATMTDDLTLDQAVEIASDVIVAGERGWNDDLWDDARSAARGCCGPDELLASVEVASVGALDGGPWRMHAEVRDEEISWYFDTADHSVGVVSEQVAPALEVGGSWVVAFEDTPFDVAAVAMLDRGQLGAVLRLTTAGTLPQSIDVPLLPIEGSATFSPFIVAGAVVPWIDGGFTAQLLGPDGTTLLTRSDLDLP